jgi:hypothetical protein
MTSEDIRKLLALGEGQRIEFKCTCVPVQHSVKSFVAC